MFHRTPNPLRRLARRCLIIVLLVVLSPRVDAAQHADPPSPLFLPIIAHVIPPPAPTDGRPSWSAPLALSADEHTLWAVNADAGSITAVDTETETVVAEIAVGEEPVALAVAPDDRAIYVVDAAAGALTIVDARTYTVTAMLDVGPEPAGIALSPSGRTAYVALTAADEIVVVDLAARRIVHRVAVAAKPYAIAVTDDADAADNDETVLVTHFWARPRADGEPARDDGREGVVSRIRAADHGVGEIVLPPNENGFANLIAGVALHQDRAWLPHLRAAPDAPVGLTTTVFAAVSSLALSEDEVTEDANAYLPLNDQEIFGSPVNNPVAAVPSPDGERLYVVLAGSDLLEVIDVADPTAPRLVRFLATGRNPQGIAVRQDGARGYVLNALSRSVTVFDLAALTLRNEIIVTGETLDAATLRGKILFNHAADPRLSQGSWISCASCHPNGGADGVTWLFPDGIRQTPPLWNATATLPWHWSAALDEAQDVETTIEEIQHGVGLAPGTTNLLGASPGRPFRRSRRPGRLHDPRHPPAQPARHRQRRCHRRRSRARTSTLRRTGLPHLPRRAAVDDQRAARPRGDARRRRQRHDRRRAARRRHPQPPRPPRRNRFRRPLAAGGGPHRPLLSRRLDAHTHRITRTRPPQRRAQLDCAHPNRHRRPRRIPAHHRRCHAAHRRRRQRAPQQLTFG
ncbi:MAG: hypothetical protein R2856_27585 [Caldilineaceae bacterium]